MEDIDPKLLRAFLCVARERSMSAAAGRLGLSPKAVSGRIRTLERRVGARLFHRDGRGLGLSPSARGLMPAAREIVEMHDRLYERAASMAGRDPVGSGAASRAGAMSAGDRIDR